MADVRPFVATRFTLGNGADLSEVITPPYDVITGEMQEAFYDRNPNNLVRIDFGKDLPDDNEYENRYTRAGALWQQWKKDGTLEEDQKRCFYIYEQAFKLGDGRRHRRRGFFAAVRLEDFSEGGIRAHEQTYEGPKADRFRLFRATNANLSPIFCVYDDPGRRIDRILAKAIKQRAPIETKFDGVTQRVWTLCDPESIIEIHHVMADLPLYIADGHHRYETSLAYRDEMRAATGKKNGFQPWDFAMMYLNNIHGEGMVVLPTHRVLCKEACFGVDPEEVLEDIGECFTVTPLEFDRKRAKSETRRLVDILADAGANATSFVMVLPKQRPYLLTLKPGVDLDEMIDDEHTPRQVKQLDVTILHSYLINRGWLGNPEIELDEHDLVYVKDAAEVLAKMSTCKYCVGFLLNSTRIDQVCAVAEQGLRMPHKSTYFFPKVVTGLVMRDLSSPW